jgi:hypothetical protein
MDNQRAVIIGSGTYGLCYGFISATDDEIVKFTAVRVTDARHIAYYRTVPGGLTSLAVFGPHDGSRIGAPCPSALVMNVKNVFDCSPEAVEKFSAMAPNAG